MMQLLPQAPPSDDHVVATTLRALYDWDYGSEAEPLRALYAKGVELQWNAMKSLPWDEGIDRNAFRRSFTMSGVPVHKTQFWRSLSADVQWNVSRRGAAWVLSNFLHGEQGALLVASQLVNAVPHLDAKLHAAVQTLDEARHVEVFSAYLRLLDEIHPVAPGVRRLLDATIRHDNWIFKCVGMQIVIEGVALFSFRDLRDTSEDPLFKQLLTYVARDEARHTAYGIKYLEAIVPTLGDQERSELEDFAFEACRAIVDTRSGVNITEAFNQIWADAGVDPVDAWQGLAREQQLLAESVRRMGGRIGPTTGMVVPTLKRVGLFSDRIRQHFHDVFEQLNITIETGDPHQPKGNPIEHLRDLPEDLEAWVLSAPQ
jgi:hypothetical protein